MLVRSCFYFGLLFVLTITCGTCIGQTHFEKRMTVIENDLKSIPATTSGTIVMLGDSITEQFSTNNCLPDRIGGLLVINQGIGGDDIGTSVSSTGVLSRLDQVKQAKPAIVFVMIGINCLWDKEGTADQAIKQYEAMVPALKAAVPDARIVLQSVLPTAGDINYTNPKAGQLNDQIEKLAKEHGAVWLDLRPLMQNEQGELKAEFTGDNVHLKQAAYEVWLEQLTKTVNALLK